MIRSRESYVASSMHAVEKGLPICNQFIDIKNMTECKIKIRPNSINITSADKSISVTFNSNSDVFKTLQKYSNAHVALDNVYYKNTDKLVKFIKTTSRNGLEGENGFNDKYTKEMYNDFISYYGCMDETYTNDIERRNTSYIVVDIYVQTSKEYYVTDGMYGCNGYFCRQLFRLSDGKRIWNPFYYDINYHEIDFGGPWD